MDRNAWQSSRRERILAAAKTVFGCRGFDQATIDDIVALASVSKGSIYGHFHDKEDLFYRVVEKMVTDDVTSALSASGSLSSAIQRLDSILDVFFKRVITACECDNLIFEAWASAGRKRSGLSKLLISDHKRWHGVIKGILDEGCERGEFNAGIDTEAAASLIMATLSGTIVNSRFGQKNELARLDKVRHGLLLAVSAW